ncbi:MAG: DUF4430 domain-containing protein [Firmicutes bacterium]|nr:DUF4430 domain-containing protein [Bacillota bacterium]
MDQQIKKDIVRKLRGQRAYRRFAVILAAIVVITTAASITIEPPDAKLPDGQGNIVIGNQQAEDEVKEELSEEAKSRLTPEDIKIDNSKDPTASNRGNAALRPDVAQPVTVTLEIRCDTLSGDMSKLETPGLEDYIPEDGVILQPTLYKGTTDNTVFDALNTLCRNNDIHLDFTYTPVFQANYIRGIGYLYEFDGGPASGWQYRVNGWFPNYGCSSYYLKDGDHIVWAYTCEGYGADIGNSFE